MTNANKIEVILDYILYIYYLVRSKKKNNNIEILLDFASKVYTITLVYILNLSF